MTKEDIYDNKISPLMTQVIEASHGINGMVEAATRPAIDAAIKQGGQHDHHD